MRHATKPKQVEVTYLSIAEATRITGIGRDSLQALRSDGVHKEGEHFVRINARTVIYDYKALLAWIESLKPAATKEN